MIPFMGETVCRAFNLVFIPVFLLLYIYIYIYICSLDRINRDHSRESSAIWLSVGLGAERGRRTL